MFTIVLIIVRMFVLDTGHERRGTHNTDIEIEIESRFQKPKGKEYVIVDCQESRAFSIRHDKSTLEKYSVIVLLYIIQSVTVIKSISYPQKCRMYCFFHELAPSPNISCNFLKTEWFGIFVVWNLFFAQSKSVLQFEHNMKNPFLVLIYVFSFEILAFCHSSYLPPVQIFWIIAIVIRLVLWGCRENIPYLFDKVLMRMHLLEIYIMFPFWFCVRVLVMWKKNLLTF